MDARDVEVIVLNENNTVVGALMLDIPKGEVTDYSIFIDEVNELGSIAHTEDQLQCRGFGKRTRRCNQDQLPTSSSPESNNWVALIVFAFVVGIIWLCEFSGRRGGQACSCLQVASAAILRLLGVSLAN